MTGTEAEDLADRMRHLDEIVALELRHPVPGASARLVARAAAMLDLPVPDLTWP